MSGGRLSARPVRIIIESSIPYIREISLPNAEILYRASDTFTNESIAGADALVIRSITQITPALLSGTSVKLVCTATAGFDHIDTAYCLANGVAWRNAPGCNAGAVAQYIAAVLARLCLEGSVEISKKTVMAVVGVGHVGTIVARHARALGLQVLLCDPPRAEREGCRGFVDLATAVREADILTFHVPLNYRGSYPTYHMINDDLSANLRPGVVLINASRGAVADTGALIRARRSGQIGRLVIDCWEGEPHISTELLSLADIATPHIAGFSADGKAAGSRQCIRNICSFFNLGDIDPEVIKPPDPEADEIDLEAFPDQRIARALLKTFNPCHAENGLREHPDRFEALRKSYVYPREMQAYRVLGSRPEERETLAALGFRL